MASDASLEVVASLVADANDFIQKFTNDIPQAVQQGVQKMQTAVEQGTGKIQEGLNDAAEHAREAGEATGKNFGEGLTMILAAVAATFLDKLHEAFGEATELAEDLKNAAIETGDSIGNVQRLSYAFATVGVKSEEATRSIVMLQRKLQEAGSASTGRSIFERAGLDPKAMMNNPASKNIELIADKMHSLSTAAQRSDLAMQAFGRAGIKLIPILTEGGEHLKELEKQADTAGAVISTEDVDALDELREKLNQVAETGKAFFASFLAPFAGFFKAIAQAIQDTYAAFEKLSSDSKLAVIFGAVAAAVGLAAEGMEAFRPILGSLISKEVLAGLLSVTAFIQAMVPIVALAGVAWATNFGSMKTIVFELSGAIQTWWQNLTAAFSQIADDAKTILGPSFDDLSTQVGLLLQGFVDLAKQVLTNPQAFKDLRAAADDVLNVFKNIVNFVNSDLLRVLTSLGILIVGLRLKMMFTGVVAAIQPIISIIKGLQAAYVALAAAESFANLLAIATPWGLVAIAVAALAAVVYLMWGHWKNVADAIEHAWDQIKAFVSQLQPIQDFQTVLQATIGFWQGIGNAIGGAYDKLNAYHVLNDKVNAEKRAKEKARVAAVNAPEGYVPRVGRTFDPNDDLRARELAAAAKAKHDADNQALFLANQKKAREAAESAPGTGTIAAVPKKSTANVDALDDLKDKLQSYQENIRKTQLLLSQLELAQQSLGKIDTAAKLARSQFIYAQQIAATIKLGEQERAEAAQDLRNKQAALDLASRAKDTKEQRKDREQANTYQRDADNMNLKAAQDALKVQKLHEESKAETSTFAKSQFDDKDLPLAVRLAAIDQEIANTKAKEIVSAGALQNRTAELAKLEQTRLDIMAEQAKLQNDLTNSLDANVKARVAAQRSIRDATPLGADTSGAGAQERAVADAQADQTNAAIEAAAAEQARVIAENQLTAALKSHIASDPMVIKLRTDLNNATAQATTAQAALTVSTMKLQQAQDQTDQATLTVRSSLLQMAQQVAGPVVEAFKMIEEGVNPLVAIFLSLFENSKSFNDIMIIMGKIIDQVAKIFDAMRPIIDLLLGALVGIVNVFLTLYNIIVTLLDVFGLAIQKIQLVTDSLDAMNGAVPLLQVTHDLPTMNEINSGKSADLVAKANDLDNNMLTGFAQGLSKLGEIAGTLIGIFALIKIIAAYQAAKGAGGIIGAVTNAWQSVFKGGSSGAGATNNNASWGSWGSPDTDSAGSAADATGANNYGFGTGDYGSGDAADEGDLSTALDSSTTGTTITQAGGSGGILASGAGTALAGTVGAVAGGLVSKAIGGNAQDASVGGSLGGMVGGIFGGPLGSAIGSFAGEIVGGMFGPHYNQNQNPDITNAQINGEDYGQAIANLQGSTVTANNEQYQSQESEGFLQQISTYIAEGGKGLSASLLKEFTGATSIVNGKNGILDLANGVNLQWQQLVNDANTAMAAITAAGGNTATAMQSLLGGATNVNLASLFGNGTAVTSANGYNVTSGGNSTIGNASSTQPASFNVNIAAVHGTVDTAALKAAFVPIFNEYGRQQQIVARTQSSMVGRGNFA